MKVTALLLVLSALNDATVALVSTRVLDGCEEGGSPDAHHVWVAGSKSLA